ECAAGAARRRHDPLRGGPDGTHADESRRPGRRRARVPRAARGVGLPLAGSGSAGPAVGRHGARIGAPARYAPDEPHGMDCVPAGKSGYHRGRAGRSSSGGCGAARAGGQAVRAHRPPGPARAGGPRGRGGARRELLPAPAADAREPGGPGAARHGARSHRVGGSRARGMGARSRDQERHRCAVGARWQHRRHRRRGPSDGPHLGVRRRPRRRPRGPREPVRAGRLHQAGRVGNRPGAGAPHRRAAAWRAAAVPSGTGRRGDRVRAGVAAGGRGGGGTGKGGRVTLPLNPGQEAAVRHPGGPLLVLAGAGSGKTRVLTARIAHLIQERGVAPARIFAVTFTNKAAGEMRARVGALLGADPRGLWLGTFHSLSARLLRREAAHLGFGSNFTIDDLLLLPLTLFAEHAERLVYWQRRFDHVLVDEFQDTNAAQYRLVRQLAAQHTNLCVVGDDDQAIYGWRGADVRHMLSFQRDFPGATLIKLEQNYRSTQVILDAANGVIAENARRLGKTLFTAKQGGEPVTLLTAA